MTRPGAAAAGPTPEAARQKPARQEADGGQRLTREYLLSGQLEALVRATMPGVRVLDAAEREASLAAVLAARPEGAAFAVFGYGSLIWNPTIHVAGQRRVVAQGWHRSFCLLARGARGTPATPGLMLGLAPGGMCEGAALDLDPGQAETELTILWRREMVADGYIPRWVRLLTPGGEAAGWAIAFTINPVGPSYAGDLDETRVVELLATARGELGTAAEYLFNTREGLAAIGVVDPYLETIAAKVRARLAR